MRSMTRAADLHFYFDPVCPFAWMTSTWVRQVMAARDYRVEWRFISLRLVNAEVDYDAHFPSDYEFGHTQGLRMLRAAASARAQFGLDAVDALQRSFGEHIFEIPPWESPAHRRATLGSPQHIAAILAEAGLPGELSEALDDPSWDKVVMAETTEALALTGKDVGTPILHVDPPDGVAFFGPVISRRPSDDQAAELWDHVLALTRFPGFSELKRSLRERPQLPVLGVGAGEVGIQEDWHQGSRRLKR
jgi:2-hydroxychromene-2-carboxylate isomerase